MAEQNLSHRVKPGDKSIPAGPLNQAFDAAEQILSGRTRGAGIIRPDQFLASTVKLRNDSGANRALGECLRIGDSILTTKKNQHRWFAGETPDDTNRTIAILRKPIPDGGIAECQLSGSVVARVNVTDTSHGYAEPVDGSHVLTSGASGRVTILNTPTSTGEQDCFVLLGQAAVERVRYTARNFGSQEVSHTENVHVDSIYSSSKHGNSPGFSINGDGDLVLPVAGIWQVDWSAQVRNKPPGEVAINGQIQNSGALVASAGVPSTVWKDYIDEFTQHSSSGIPTRAMPLSGHGFLRVDADNTPIVLVASNVGEVSIWTNVVLRVALDGPLNTELA